MYLIVFGKDRQTFLPFDKGAEWIRKDDAACIFSGSEIGVRGGFGYINIEG